jgi:hypothetical protein
MLHFPQYFYSFPYTHDSLFFAYRSLIFGFPLVFNVETACLIQFYFLFLKPVFSSDSSANSDSNAHNVINTDFQNIDGIKNIKNDILAKDPNHLNKSGKTMIVVCVYHFGLC